MKFIAFDIESGGIGTDKTLLTVYLALLDKELNTLADIELYIKPDDGVYHVTAGGLEVNKINLVEHDKVAITYKQAGTALYTFLSRNVPPDIKLIPLGHGIAFDCNFLQETIISKGSWQKFVSYRCMCTSSIARFLMECGKLSSGLSGSLESLSEYFGVKKTGDYHNAKVDTLATIEVYKNLIRINK